MRFPLLRNGPFNTFPRETLALGEGVHLVERLRDGRYVGVTKPGYKGRDDFSVALFEHDGETRGRALSHVDMLDDFHRALTADRRLGLQFIDCAFDVFGGAEPPESLPAVETVHAPDFILKSLKWIWAQEDINYPMPRYQGRKMAGYRLRELADGIALEVVLARAEVKGARPRNLADVNYAAVDGALRQRPKQP